MVSRDIEEYEDFEDRIDFVCDLFDCNDRCDSLGHDSECLFTEPLLAWKQILQFVSRDELNAAIKSLLPPNAFIPIPPSIKEEDK